MQTKIPRRAAVIMGKLDESRHRSGLTADPLLPALLAHALLVLML